MRLHKTNFVFTAIVFLLLFLFSTRCLAFCFGTLFFPSIFMSSLTLFSLKTCFKFRGWWKWQLSKLEFLKGPDRLRICKNTTKKIWLQHQFSNVKRILSKYHKKTDYLFSIVDRISSFHTIADCQMSAIKKIKNCHFDNNHLAFM